MKTSCAVYMLCSAGPNRLLQVLMLWYRAPAVLLGAANYSNAIDIWKPGGFGFFQFLDPADPVGSKYQMDGQVVQARQLTVLFAEENRKKAADMQIREFRYNEREHSSTYLFKGFEKVGASHRWSLGPKERGTPNQTKFSQVAVVAVICVHPEPSYILLITDVLHSLIPLVPAEIGGSPRA